MTCSFLCLKGTCFDGVGVEVGGVVEQRNQIREQRRQFLRIEHGGRHQQSRRSCGNECGIGFDLLLD
jgi:hypothetical protein